MKRFFNYDAVDLLDKYEQPQNVPEDVLKQLNIYSRNPETMSNRMEWFEKNFGALKAGYKDKFDFEEDQLNMMYPEGYDPDIDGDIFDDN